MMFTKRSRNLILGLLAVVAALVASYLGISAARASSPDVAAFRPLTEASLPTNIQIGIVEAADRVGISSDEVFEAGGSSGSSDRTTVVGFDDAHQPYVAVATRDLLTSFVPVTNIFSKGPMVVLSGTSSFPGQTPEVGISVIVNGAVASIEVERPDGSTNSVELTRWPNTPYASADISSSTRDDFPVAVRAYDNSGRQVDEEAVHLPPVQ